MYKDELENRYLRIFISSTFKDTQEEREREDLLRKFFLI